MEGGGVSENWSLTPFCQKISVKKKKVKIKHFEGGNPPTHLNTKINGRTPPLSEFLDPPLE